MGLLTRPSGGGPTSRGGSFATYLGKQKAQDTEGLMRPAGSPNTIDMPNAAPVAGGIGFVNPGAAPPATAGAVPPAAPPLVPGQTRMDHTVAGFNKIADDVGGALFGNKNDPGLFGTGRWRPGEHNIDPNASTIPNADATRTALAAGAGAAGTRGAPQIATGPQDQVRADQMGLIQALVAQANGQGPSIAQGQLKRATDRNLAQTMAVASSMPQAGGAGALRQIASQRGAISQEAAGQSAEIAQTEQLQARNQLGQILAGARGQDIGLATGQAQLTAQQQAQNDEMVKFYTASGMSLDQAQQQAAMDMEKLRLQQYLGTQGLDLQAYTNTANERQDLLGAFGQMLGLGAKGPPGGG